jgi:hypothetical protein
MGTPTKRALDQRVYKFGPLNVAIVFTLRAQKDRKSNHATPGGKG